MSILQIILLALFLALTQVASSFIGFYWISKKIKGEAIVLAKFFRKDKVIEWIPPINKEEEMSKRLTKVTISENDNQT